MIAVAFMATMASMLRTMWLVTMATASACASDPKEPEDPLRAVSDCTVPWFSTIRCEQACKCTGMNCVARQGGDGPMCAIDPVTDFDGKRHETCSDGSFDPGDGRTGCCVIMKRDLGPSDIDPRVVTFMDCL